MAPRREASFLRCLDHVVLAAADLDGAVAAHAALLGREPSWRGAHPLLGTRNALFRLDNTYVELLAGEAASSGLGALVDQALRGRSERPFALALGVGDLAAAVRATRGAGIGVAEPQDGEGREESSGVMRTWRSAFVDPDAVRGLRLLLIEHTSPAGLLPLAPYRQQEAASCAEVDHVVVFTEDLDASRSLWSDRFGLTCAWQRDFPERQTRNAGLDVGGITLELIERQGRAPRGRPDVFWGMAYRVADCEMAVTRLRAAQIAVDEPRDGLDPGTRVASVRWQRTPTLVIARPPSGAKPR